MVISHKFKYVFVEFPLTGSTSIKKDLVENYDGEPILFKHATYLDFLKIATEEEKSYFVFSCIRNPLDQAVSHYFKYKTDHRGRYSKFKKYRGINRLVFQYQINRFNYASKTNFNEYFLKYYKLPYNAWSSLSHPYCDYIIRFENLNSNYLDALKLIGIIEPLRPLPKANVTNKESTDFLSYYSQKSIIRAKKVFKEYMQLMDYEFPKEWGNVTTTKRDQLLFKLINIPMNIYWRYMRFYIFKNRN